jgi:hypothetical protein
MKIELAPIEVRLQYLLRMLTSKFPEVRERGRDIMRRQNIGLFETEGYQVAYFVVVNG